MSEPENFLTRWSRRKAELGREEPRESRQPAEPERKQLPAADAAPAALTEENNDEREGDGEVDLSKLPSLDSIGAGTDVRAFLQKGVPVDLARAALRRAWATDPVIRDFIGIAENQYDFATGSDIPGFGPLTPADDVARMLAQVLGEGVPQPLKPSVADGESNEPKSETAQPDQPSAEAASAAAVESETTTQADPMQFVDAATQQDGDTVTQQDGDNAEDEPAQTRRTHGGALPR